MKKVISIFITLVLVSFGFMYMSIKSSDQTYKAVVEQTQQENPYDTKKVTGLETSNAFTAAYTSTGVLVTTASTQVLATTTARSVIRISNISGNAMYCNLNNGLPAVAFSGVAVFASSTLTLSDAESLLYRGAVNCIAVGGNASTTAFQR